MNATRTRRVAIYSLRFHRLPRMQKTKCAKPCSRLQSVMVWEIVQQFSDPGISGGQKAGMHPPGLEGPSCKQLLAGEVNNGYGLVSRQVRSVAAKPD